MSRSMEPSATNKDNILADIHQEEQMQGGNPVENTDEATKIGHNTAEIQPRSQAL